jgi:uncharacterized protein (DUF1800 family)
LLKRLEWSDQIGERIGSRIAAATLAPKILGDTVGEHTRLGIARAESGAQALTLLLASPEFLRR